MLLEGETVVVNIVREYSGKGGFPSGPYFVAELFDGDGQPAGRSRRHLSVSEARSAARVMAKRRRARIVGWTGEAKASAQ